jgi:hypothetical protein
MRARDPHHDPSPKGRPEPYHGAHTGAGAPADLLLCHYSATIEADRGPDDMAI